MKIIRLASVSEIGVSLCSLGSSAIFLVPPPQFPREKKKKGKKKSRAKKEEQGSKTEGYSNKFTILCGKHKGPIKEKSKQEKKRKHKEVHSKRVLCKGNL